MDEQTRREIALLRFSVLGPLTSARLEHGDKKKLFEQAAARSYQGPGGKVFRVQARTVEDWYYAWKAGGLEALAPRRRSDAGTSRVIPPEIGDLILAIKQEKPRRSIRRIIKMIERAGKLPPGVLKKSTVHRYLKHRGLSSRPRRVYEERRPYRLPFAGDLWIGDVMHGPAVVTADNQLRKSYGHVLIDSATRYLVDARFRVGETAVDVQRSLKEAIRTCGLPRTLYLDRGSGQRADSLRLICAELKIRLSHTRAYDPAAKGVVEKVIRTIREEVIDELDDTPITRGELNSVLWAWRSVEYHRRVHDTTDREPLEHWLSHLSRLRPAPPPEALDRAFLHRDSRVVRRDGTIRFEGGFLEVHPTLRPGQEVELRFDPHTPQPRPEVYVDGEFVCDTVQADPIKNSTRPRRRIVEESMGEAQRPPSGLNPLEQIKQEHERRLDPPGSTATKRKED